VDLDTGEILRPQAQETTRNTRKRLDPTPSESLKATQAQLSEKFKNPLFFLFPIGTSLFFCLITCLLGYFFYENHFTRLSLQAEQTTEKITNLHNQVNELQTVFSSYEDSEEFLGQLEALTISLEQIESTLQKHIETTKHAPQLSVIKKTSPNESLKNIAYLGFYGTSINPIALIRIKDEQKELSTGQFIIDLWKLTSIHPTHLILTHSDGMVQQIARKKSLF
jgi:hypothetical protein